MKYTIKCLLILLLVSCKEDEFKLSDTKHLLTKSTWKQYLSIKTTYSDFELDRSDTTKYNYGDQLTFYKDEHVELLPYSLDTVLLSNWTLSEGDEYLSTNLMIDLPPASGYRGRFFYNHSKIIKLTQDLLLLRTDSSNRVYSTFKDGIEESTHITTINDIHFLH